MRLFLATCAAWPDGEPGGALLVEALAAEHVGARWVVWDDPTVRWADADAVAVRSTWDYHDRRDEYVDWARRVEAETQLLNGADVFAWNTDKAYLVDLADAGLPVVPTMLAADESALIEAVGELGTAVVKPAVGASGGGVLLVERGVAFEPGPGPWVVQPMVESVRTEGETSVFVFGGEVAAQVRKVPGGTEIRVHEFFGGRSDLVDVTEEAEAFATRSVAVAERLLGVGLPYARVDVMRRSDGDLLLGELELTEPGLYLDVAPANAAAFARMVGRTVKEGRSESR